MSTALTPAKRRRRWPRRIAIALVIWTAVVTAASAIYNVATQKRAAVPSGLSYVQAGDVHTRYRVWGTSGSPIVLVHGFIESSDTWEPTAKLLAAAGHRVYALDLDGFGYSARVPPFDRIHLAQQLLDFVAALKLNHPAVVGHSSGAAITATAALQSPGTFSGLLFLDGDGLATGAGQRNPLTQLLIDPYRTSLLRIGIGSDTVLRAIYRRACGSGCPRLDRAGLDQWRRPLQVPGAESALFAMLNLGVPGLPPQELARLKLLALPKRVVFGGADSAYDKDTPQTTAARIGAPAPTVIPGAAHLTPVNSPAAVAAAIEAMVA